MTYSYWFVKYNTDPKKTYYAMDRWICQVQPELQKTYYTMDRGVCQIRTDSQKTYYTIIRSKCQVDYRLMTSGRLDKYADMWSNISLYIMSE